MRDEQAAGIGDVVAIALILASVALVIFFLVGRSGAQTRTSSGHSDRTSRQKSTGAGKLAKANPPVGGSLFERYDPEALGESELENHLRDHEKSNAFYSTAELSTGKPFAVLIGFDDQWLNVVALNRARSPVYQRYGFNVKDARWSYGSPPLGAPEIRELVEQARPEILEKIALLEPARRDKAVRRAQHEAREQAELEAEQAEMEAEKRELQRVQDARASAISSYFGGLNFEFNENKARHLAAQKHAENHHYPIDLETQTCGCKDFATGHANYSTWDVRRLCSHLSYIVENNSLLRRNPNTLHQFILEEFLHDVAGVYIGQLIEAKEFAVVVRRGTKIVSVATPRVRGDGFTKTAWRFGDGVWTSGTCSRTYAQAIQDKLAELLPE